MSTAETIIEKFASQQLALEACENTSAQKEQDWENETTTFIFDDGSSVQFSGPHYNEVIKSYVLTEAGRAEAVRQYLREAKDGSTDDQSAYSDEFLKLEEDCGMQNGKSASCEISQHQTKSGNPEHIYLDDEHFAVYWIEA